MTDTSTQWIGWAASALLFLTLAGQLRAQWRARSTEGVSPVLYGGQILASVGFATYSAMIGNWVFIITNGLLVGAAVMGLVLWFRFRREERAEEETETAPTKESGPLVQVTMPRRKTAPPKSADASNGGRRWTFAGIRRRLTRGGGRKRSVPEIERPAGRWG